MSYGIDGFAFASESLVGRFKGAADEVNLNKSIRYSFVWGFALAVIYSALYTGFGNQLLYVFTNQEEVIRFTQKLLPWMMIMPILGFASYIWDGVFVGLVAGKAMRNSMILSFALYLIAYYACNPYVEYHAIWIALSVFLISRAAFQFLLYRMQGNELT
jgi:MATE family multidrug resistance protein